MKAIYLQLLCFCDKNIQLINTIIKKIFNKPIESFLLKDELFFLIYKDILIYINYYS